MDQYEARKKDIELSKKYKNLLSAVEDNDIKTLKKHFPTAKDIIEFNQNRRTREFNALEAMVVYSSPEFIKSVFDTYFKGDDNEILELKDKFLQARSITGVKLNYKYFAPYLPQELTDSVASCYGVKKTTQRQDFTEIKIQQKQDEKRISPNQEEPKTVAEKITLFLKRIDEKINKKAKKTVDEVKSVDTRPRMEQIYDIIKKENRSLNEYRNQEVKRRHLDLRDEDEKPVEVLYTSRDKSKALVIKREAMPSIFVRKASAIDQDHDEGYKKYELVRIDFANNFDGTREDLVKSLYTNADFPEDYMWAVSSLRKFENEYAKIVETDSVNLAQVKEFAKSGGRFFIEEGETNIGNTEHYIACAGEKEGYSYIAFNSEEYAKQKGSDNVLLHELTHRADKNSGEIFSQTEFFKQMAVLMVAENDEGRAAQKARHIANNYKQGAIYSELLAYMIEGGADGVKDSKLATLVRDIYGIYVNAKVHDDTKTMEMIASYKLDWMNNFVQQTFELSNGEVVCDKEKLSRNIPTVAEELDKFKESLGYKVDIEFPLLLKEKYDQVHVSMAYMDFLKEQKGIKNKDQAFENFDKWIENISKSDNKEDFLKAVTMAYCYTKPYRKTEQDIFEEANISTLTLSDKDNVAKMFREEITHLKALEIKPCSKAEAILANDINMPIKELMTYKEMGIAKIILLKDNKDIKETLEQMIVNARESGGSKDFLKLQGAVEFIGKKKGIENPLGYEIKTKDMLEVVDTLTERFIDAHFPKKENVSPQSQNDVTISQRPQTPEI